MKEVLSILVSSFLLVCCKGQHSNTSLNFILFTTDTLSIYPDEIEIIDEYSFILLNNEKLNVVKNSNVKDAFVFLNGNEKQLVELFSIYASNLPKNELYILSDGNGKLALFNNNNVYCSEELINEMVAAGLLSR
jgi:hypothetical protein